MRTPGLLLAAAFALATFASPGLGLAAHRHHEAGPSYPMEPTAFRKLVDKRIDRVRAAIDKKLDRYGVAADRKKAIHKMIEDASKDVRTAVDEAAADGKITKAEADKVMGLAGEVRTRVRARIKAEKSPKPAATKAGDGAGAAKAGDGAGAAKAPGLAAGKKKKPAKGAHPASDVAKPAKTMTPAPSKSGKDAKSHKTRA
jgi:hypothetical protein